MKILGKYLVISACQLSAMAALAVEPEQIAKLLADDAMPGDRVGVSVAISNDTAVVGTDQGALANSGKGAAYVFTKSETGSWRQQTKLMASDGAAGDGFGNSVSIDADIIVIGAPGDDDKGDRSGSAYVFVRNGDGTWPDEETLKLTASDGGPFDRFGLAVAVSGQTIFVGAPWNGPGEVYAFEPTNAGGWIESYVFNGGESFGYYVTNDPNARFGRSISAVSSFDEPPIETDFDGILVIIGAPGESIHGKAWTWLAPHASIINVPVHPNLQLGFPIGSAPLIEHAPCDGNPNQCGQDKGQPMLFGWSVDIDAGAGLSADHPRRTHVIAMIGAPGFDDHWIGPDFNYVECVDSGAAYQYFLTVDLGFGVERLGTSCHDNARLGWTVAISLERRGTILMGAPFFDPSGLGTPGLVLGLESATESLTGWSSLFSEFPDPYQWGKFALLANDAPRGDTFGWAVAIDGDTSVIGNRAHNAATGSAYVFQQTPRFASELLFRFITSLNLRGGTERSLTVKVSNIEEAIIGGDVNLALNLLNAFVEDVTEKSGTQVTGDESYILTLWAIEIVSLLTFD